MSFSPDLIFLDENNQQISSKIFEPIKRGTSSKVYTLKIHNIGDDCPRVQLKPILTRLLTRDVDTAGSTYLSLNNSDFYNELNFELKHNETVTFYLKWQPPFNAFAGNVNWGLIAYVHTKMEIVETC